MCKWGGEYLDKVVVGIIRSNQFRRRYHNGLLGNFVRHACPALPLRTDLLRARKVSVTENKEGWHVNTASLEHVAYVVPSGQPCRQHHHPAMHTDSQHNLLHQSMPSHTWAGSSLSLDVTVAYVAPSSAMVSSKHRKGDWEKRFFFDAAISCEMRALNLPAVPFSDLRCLRRARVAPTQSSGTQISGLKTLAVGRVSEQTALQHVLHVQLS